MTEAPKKGPTDLSSVESLLEGWPKLYASEKSFAFCHLPRGDAETLFRKLKSKQQAELLRHLPEEEQRIWIRILAPHEAANLIAALPSYQRTSTLALLDEQSKAAVNAFLVFAEDNASGLMNPRFARVRPEMTVDEAINYLRVQSTEQTLPVYYAYVCDSENHLKGVVSFRMLFAAAPGTAVRDVMIANLVTVPEHMDKEDVSRLFSHYKFVTLPVIDRDGCMKGIVTADDMVSVVQDEATEDMQKMGGMSALDAPYLQMTWAHMVKKRAGWLMALFVGEMFTATAMGYYEHEISKAVVLALFIPLIISSGGNSGSQATTLIIRALALGELRLKDWWKVFFRELSSGMALGVILGTIGFIRIIVWPNRETLYGEHYVLVSLTVAFSLVGIVLWGSLMGSMMPFIFRRLGFDPASASAPFVATMVDVTGLIIYFTVAGFVLGGTLL